MLSVGRNHTHHANAHNISILFNTEKSLKTHHIRTNVLSKTIQIKNPEYNLQLKYNHFKKCCGKSCNLNVVREIIGKIKFVPLQRIYVIF